MQIITEPREWNRIAASLNGSVLQSWEWGALKQDFGWEPMRLAWISVDGQPEACAQLLIRRPHIPLIGSRIAIHYCPRGPLLNWSDAPLRDAVLNDLVRTARENGAIFLKIDPDVVTGRKKDEESDLVPDTSGTAILQALEKLGFHHSDEQIQFANTMELDLDQSPDAILAGMKQKTRYNIRLAGRKGVTVRRGGPGDLDLLYKMYAETSIRDGFIIRKPEYYQLAWGSFIEAGLAQPFIAEVEDEVVAAIIIFKLAEKAIYMYGMSTQAHRNKMPNHLLQWEAIQWAIQSGCKVYDFWGAPDEITPDDSMWGVYRFKLGFGACFVRTVGAMDFVTRPLLHGLYTHVMPRVLNILRLRGRAQTRQHLEV